MKSEANKLMNKNIGDCFFFFYWPNALFFFDDTYLACNSLCVQQHNYPLSLKRSVRKMRPPLDYCFCLNWKVIVQVSPVMCMLVMIYDWSCKQWTRFIWHKEAKAFVEQHTLSFCKKLMSELRLILTSTVKSV